MQALQKISHIKLFTTLGACSGSWHLPVASTADEANHEHLTTFVSPNGCCCFNRLPFSISSAPEHFQRNISQMLETVFPRVCASHGQCFRFWRIRAGMPRMIDTKLTTMMRRLQDAGITLRVGTYSLYQERVNFCSINR